jgi:hypothetical protein
MQLLGCFFADGPGCPISHDRFLVERCGKLTDVDPKLARDIKSFPGKIRLLLTSPDQKSLLQYPRGERIVYGA